jgi:hypothetical protein
MFALISLRNWPSVVAPQSLVSDSTVDAHKRLHGSVKFCLLPLNSSTAFHSMQVSVSQQAVRSKVSAIEINLN